MSKKKKENKQSPLSRTAEILKDKKETINEPINDDDDISDVTRPLESKTDCSGYMFMLYPDTIDYDFAQVLGQIIDNCDKQGHTYAWVMHDKDLYKENTFDKNHKLIGVKGQYKKRHIHVLVLCKDSKIVPLSKIKPDKLDDRFVEKVPVKNEINATLYLSHINHPEKTYYDYVFISTNNRDWVSGVHQNYRPFMILDYVQKYLDDNDKYISFTQLYRHIMNINKGNYGNYKNNYSIIRDMVNEHNKYVSQVVKTSQVVDHVKTNLMATQYENMKAITDLVNDFGIADYEFNGKTYQIIQKQEQKKK